MRFMIQGNLAQAERLRGEARAARVACVEDLEIAAREGSSRVREVALEVLLELAPERAEVVALERLVNDPENEVRGTAAVVLSHFNDAAALEPLVRALGSSPALRMGAEQALCARMARAPELARWLLAEYIRASSEGAQSAADRILVLLAPHWSDEADLAVRASVARTGHVPELLANDLTHAPGEVCDRTLAFLAASKNERVREEAKCAISERAWRAAFVEATARIERFVREGAGSDLFYASSTQIRDAVTLAFEGDAEFVFDRLSAFTLGGSRSSEWARECDCC